MLYGVRERSVVYVRVMDMQLCVLHKHSGGATRLSRGVSRLSRCHGLVPWSFTLVATDSTQRKSSMPRACPVESHAGRYRQHATQIIDATGLSRGVSRWSLQTARNANHRCHGLVPWRFTIDRYTASNVRLHGTSPWHLETRVCLFS